MASGRLLAGALAIAALGAGACNVITGAAELEVQPQGMGGAGTGTTSSSTTSSGTHTSSSSSSSSTTSSSSSTTSSSSSTTSSSTSGSTDPDEMYRQACIDKINALRATKGLSAYKRWTTAEACVDQQATHDDSVMIAHDAFSHGTPSCGGNGQNECPNYGSPAAITGCLDQMWAERMQAGCSGCDACDTFTIFQGQCPNCSFNGSVVCGHYVNMSSKDFTEAACGFSKDGTWAAINFQ